MYEEMGDEDEDVVFEVVCVIETICAHLYASVSKACYSRLMLNYAGNACDLIIGPRR